MTTSNPEKTSKPPEAESVKLAPTLKPDPGGVSANQASPPGSPALSPDLSGYSQNAADPGASLPQGLGSGLIGPWPPNQDDPRLTLGAHDPRALWSLALNLAEGYDNPTQLGSQIALEAPLTWPDGPGESTLPAAPEAAAAPVPYGAPTLELSKYPETGAPFDLSGAGPLIAALGLPKADIPNLGAVNEASAESRFLPSWLTGEATLPPWGIDWAQAAGEAPPNPGPGLGVMERPSLEVLGLEVHEPLGYRGYPGYQGYQGDGAAPDGAKPKAEKGTPGASGLDLAHGFQNLPTLAPPPYVGHISVGRIREDFPILQRTVEGGQPLIWFDNAATTQKPRQVIDRLVRFYQEENSNVHRGAHTLANKATEAYEEARRKVAAFIGAGGPENVVFVRGTTEGINLVAHAFVAPKLTPGDEIILTELEHHANIVPWQIVASQKGAYIKVLPIDDRGQLILSKLPGLVSPRTKVIALAHVSNALGTVTEIPEVIALAKSQGIPVVIDAAQSVAHLPLDVKALGADFLVFSGHKIYGPTGIGVVYGTSEALNQAQPWQGGGNMISDVTFERTLYREPPVKFEAGTPNIAGAVGLAAALDYVGALGIDRICLYEEALLHYLTDRLRTVPGLTLIGTAAKRAGVVSFVLANRSVADVGTHLARYGIALRAGHHCAQPAVRRFGLEGTVRPAPAFYNTPAEVDRFVEILGLLV